MDKNRKKDYPKIARCRKIIMNKWKRKQNDFMQLSNMEGYR